MFEFTPFGYLGFWGTSALLFFIDIRIWRAIEWT